MNIARPLGWIGLVGGLLAQVCAYLLALVVAPEHAAVTWLAIVGTAASLSGILVIGAVRNGRLSPAATTATWLLLLLPLLGFGAAVLLPAEAIGDPLILGLPRRAAMVLIGVGVLPLLVLPLAYARESAHAPLDAEALRTLRTEAERLRSGSA